MTVLHKSFKTHKHHLVLLVSNLLRLKAENETEFLFGLTILCWTGLEVNL